jgi:hypothetical protein
LNRERFERGQSLIIFAAAIVGLIAAVGLAVDAGSLYVRYGQLKRAIDAAAITAANEFKTGQSLDKLYEAAEEVIKMHELDMSAVDLEVYICDAYEQDLVEPFTGDPDGTRDRYLQTREPEFYARCPNTESGLVAPRKLIWVQATQVAPLYFMSVIGFNDVPLRAHTITEAAPVDLVIVIDISESMGADTPGFVPADFNPAGCNASNTCQPLADAKNAATILADKMHQGYDRVAVVTFDTSAETHAIPNIQGISTSLSDDMDQVKLAINNIQLHDDAPFNRLWPMWKNPGLADGGGAENYFAFNPVNPEDRDGDGRDEDPAFPPCIDIDGTVNNHPMCCELINPSTGEVQHWVEDPKFAGFNFTNNGFPCDSDKVLDAYDWDLDGSYTNFDRTTSEAYLGYDLSDEKLYELSPLSTCSGCGMREANNILNSHGRAGAVWIIVFLSDGAVNYADRAPFIPSQYTNSFCFGTALDDNPSTLAVESMTSPAMYSWAWNAMCKDRDTSVRMCIDDDISTCPPGSVWEDPTSLLYGQIQYSVFDYALDMTDDTALTEVTGDEPIGNDIGIFTIGLGAVVKESGGVVTDTYGEDLLRYMASVGDDGDRTTDPCNSVAPKSSCGQYYYAPTGEELLPIFEEIANRIYTRISQ